MLIDAVRANENARDTEVSETASSIAESITNITTIINGDEYKSPLTTKGDIHGFDTADKRIPVGTDDQVLTADSAQALGVKWSDGGSAILWGKVVSGSGNTYTVTKYNKRVSGSADGNVSCHVPDIVDDLVANDWIPMHYVGSGYECIQQMGAVG